MTYVCCTCTAAQIDKPKHCHKCGSKNIMWMPTADEIREACEEIQATWTRTTRIARGETSGEWETPQVRQYAAGQRRMRDREDAQ